MKPFAPMRLRSWLRGPKIGSKAGTAWSRRAPLPCRPFLARAGDDDLESADPTPRLSSDVQKWSRDLARCVGVIHFDHNIDRGAADLQRAKMIDRPSGHLTPESGSISEFGGTVGGAQSAARECVLRRQPRRGYTYESYVKRCMTVSGYHTDYVPCVSHYGEAAHARAKRSPDPPR